MKPVPLSQRLLNNSTAVLFVAVVAIFTVLSFSSKGDFRILNPENLVNIVKNASFTGMIAVGMTFVLLTGGIDLSVGSTMYLAALSGGYAMIYWGFDIIPALLIAMLIGVGIGALNGLGVVALRIIPFMVTLGMQVIARGMGTVITDSKQLDYPPAVNQFGQINVLGIIPIPIIFFAIVIAIAYYILTRTAFGRQIYAVGNDIEAAKKAGINTDRVQFFVYVISGLCAGIAGFVLVSQIGGRVDRSFAEGNEFNAIAAAVLGGTSLFGGVGNVFGAVSGAVLVQMVQYGLQFNEVNLYLQPMVKALVIFLAVFFDSLRDANLKKLKRRFIRPTES
jgi:ribose/xylose/arabinose/galactoside ABC-type transport system permease subunit